MDGFTHEIAQLINTVGFPIFVAVWSLVKSSKDSQKITEALTQLEKTIAILSDRVTPKEASKE